jgi:glycosyltransferase involved in cell wall biosynthesis
MNTNSRVGYRCLPALKTECSQLKTLDIIHLEDVGGAIEKYAWAAQHINQRVCISHHLKEYMRGVYLRENISAQLNERIEVIHNGTQHIEAAHAQTIKGQFRKKHSIAPDEIIITFVGRMAPEKKPFLFIDIARLLINKSPMTTFKFVMAGGGPYVSKIQNRIKECGMQDQFILPGMMDDITPLLADTFLLYVVSRHEGIPLVIQEAQAMNIPVISTNVGAIRELISDGVNGYLINLDENTAENFADKTMALLSDRQKYESMVASSKTALFPEFSMERMLTRYKEIFHKLLLEKK